MKTTSLLAIALQCIFALPVAASVTSTSAISIISDLPTAPKLPCALLCPKSYHLSTDPSTGRCRCIPNSNPPCTKLCILGTHLVSDPSTGTCRCEPDATQDTCLAATTCIVGSNPVWDPTTKTCSCAPDVDDGETICLTATECLPGLVPVWNSGTRTCACNCPKLPCVAGQRPLYDPTTSRCSCKKVPAQDPVVQARQHAERDVPGDIAGARPVSVPSVAPAPTRVPCEYLRVYCEFGDHKMHWSEEEQRCQCPAPACSPTVRGCEIGDQGGCRCRPPAVTDYAPEPFPTV